MVKRVNFRRNFRSRIRLIQDPSTATTRKPAFGLSHSEVRLRSYVLLMFYLCFAYVLLMFHISSLEKCSEIDPFCKENHEEHDFDEENRWGGPKEVQIGTAGDRKSITNPVPIPPRGADYDLINFLIDPFRPS